jgi:hypothetical protein
VTHFIVLAMPHVSEKTGEQRLVIDGFYSQGKSPNWRRKRRYEAWKRWVQEHAVLGGLELPLRGIWYVVTAAYFQDRRHPDTENVHKGIVDSLCYVSLEERELGVKKGSDKHWGGVFMPSRYDAERPRVEVWLLGEEESFELRQVIMSKKREEE